MTRTQEPGGHGKRKASARKKRARKKSAEPAQAPKRDRRGKFIATGEPNKREAKRIDRQKKRLADGGAIVHITPDTAAIVFDGKSLDDWTDRELLEGRRFRNGQFRGPAPRIVPAALHRELTKRRFQRAYALMADSLVDAATMLRTIINDDEAGYGHRIRAAEVLFDRVIGKPKEHIALDVGGDSPDLAPWQRAVATGLVGSIEDIPKPSADADSADVVEGEIVEDQHDSRTPQPKPRRKRQAP